MADAFIIETRTLTAGIAAAQGSGYRFYASHPAASSMEGQYFGSLQAAQRAAEKLASDSIAVSAPQGANA